MNNKEFNKDQWQNDKKEAIGKIFEQLENGIKNFTNTDEYLKYLDFISKFHNYSYNNSLLIYLQYPQATLLKGFKGWTDLERNVKKGFKAIKILAPVMYSKEVEKNGELKEEKHLYFKTVNVFDISQTEGKDVEIPTVIQGLKGNTDMLETFIKVVKVISNIDIEYKKGITEKGYFVPLTNQIVIKEGLSQVQTAKTVIHELTHSILHNKEFDYQTNRGQAETEAESVAYIVCKYFNIDTDDYSFPYISGWSKTDIKVLQKSLDQIQKTSQKIIEEIEKIMGN